jgi:acyl-CoA dehydrogenase
MDESLRTFRASVAQFIKRELLPRQDFWRSRGMPDPDCWTKLGSAGLLLTGLPVEFDGGGGTFVHEGIIIEELTRVGINLASYVHDGVAHYIEVFGNAEQKKALLPRMAKGELVGAIALTEPRAGSDLQRIGMVARREGDQYVVRGSKTFVTNGCLANLVCLAVRTGPPESGIAGISLLLVETDNLAGFHRGNPLKKVGMHGQDTCELFFDDARVPQSVLLGKYEDMGFGQIVERMTYERLAIGLGAVAAAETAVALTAEYVKQRSVYGAPLLDLQNTRFVLAEGQTKVKVGRAFINECISAYVSGTLDPVTAAQAKYWSTDMECEVLDCCLQLFGGYGYMDEYQVARMWADSRVHKIYGGANEVLKELIASEL